MEADKEEDDKDNAGDGLLVGWWTDFATRFEGDSNFGNGELASYANVFVEFGGTNDGAEGLLEICVG